MIVEVTETTYMGVTLFYVKNHGWKFAFGENEYLFPNLQAAESAIMDIKQVIIPKHRGNKISNT